MQFIYIYGKNNNRLLLQNGFVIFNFLKKIILYIFFGIKYAIMSYFRTQSFHLSIFFKSFSDTEVHKAVKVNAERGTV